MPATLAEISVRLGEMKLVVQLSLSHFGKRTHMTQSGPPLDMNTCMQATTKHKFQHKPQIHAHLDKSRAHP